jgi:hypothetical protein
MVTFLHGLHSGVRYLVLLAALAAIALALANLQRAGALARAERAAMGLFVGLLDLQVVLGVLLLLFWPFYGALIGHIAMMVLAAAVAHAGSIMARRREPDRSGATVRIMTVVLALVLVVGGLMAIQRSVI